MPAPPPDNPDSASGSTPVSVSGPPEITAPEFSEREVYALGSLADSLRKCADLKGVCTDLADRLAELAQLDDCVVYVRHGNLLVQTAAYPTSPSAQAPNMLLERIALPLGSGIVGQAAVRRAPVYVRDLDSDSLDQSPQGSPQRRSEYAVPMINNGELIGVIDSQSTVLEGFGAGRKTLMRAAADVAATVVASHRNLDAGTSSNALTNVVAELAALPAFGEADYIQGVELLVERTATVLQVSKVSLWLLEDHGLALVDEFRLDEGQHSKEGLMPADALRWFAEEGADQGVLVVGDTLRDARGRHLVCSDRESEITVSAMNAPIRSAGELSGILCLDVCEARRQWTEAEVAFAGAIADIVAFGLVSVLKTRAEVAMVEAQRLEALGRLAGGVAHDFNNLLTIINGSVNMLLQRGLSPVSGAQLNLDADQERLLKMVEQAGNRAQKLTRQLLAFGKKQRLTMQVIDARGLFDEALQLVRGAMREDIQVVLDQSEQPCWIECDRDQLEQTLLNLLINAIDAMPLGGRLRLSVAIHDNEVICRIEDSGAGVPNELRHRVFEPFFTTKGEQGTGLGLAVGYGIVQQHGGELRLGRSDDKSYGGALFEICLPLQVAPVFSSGDIRVTEPNVALQIGGKVLLVEDEPDVRFVVERMLTRLGFEAVVAKDAGDALRLLSERNISVLLTDVVMPDIRGPELFALAQQQKPDLRVLFISGYAESSLIDVPADRDSVRYLAKPFTLQALESSLFELFRAESERSPIKVETLLPGE